MSWIAYRAGAALILRIVPSSSLSIHERSVFSLGVGYTLVSLITLGVGMSGHLSALTVGGALFLLALIALILDRTSGLPRLAPTFLLGLNARKIALAALVLLPLVLSLLRTSLPPIGNDALAYHLDHPRQFVENGLIGYLPFTRDSLWPYQQEMLFTIGLLFEGTTLAQFFHWIFYGLTAWAAYSFGLRFYGHRVGFWSAVIFLYTPVAFAQASEAYIDLAVVYYVFLAFYGMALYFTGMEAQRSALLSGILCGSALSTKLLAIDAFIALALIWTVLSRKHLKSLVLFLLSAGIVSGIWYLRSWVILGNPVYPVLSELFGGNGYSSGIDRMKGMGTDPISFLLLPWNLTMFPGKFGGEYVGPIFLMFTPLLLVVNRFRISKMARYLIYGSLFYIALIFFQAQHMRYFFSISALLSIASAVSLVALSERGRILKVVAWSSIAAVLAIHTLIFFHRSRTVWPVLLGFQTKEAYLLKHERSYEGHRYLRERFPEGAAVFNSGEARLFYSPFRMLTDNEALRDHLDKTGGTIDEYILSGDFDAVWVGNTDEDRRLAKFVSSKGYTLVHSYSFTEKPADFYFEIYQKKRS